MGAKDTALGPLEQDISPVENRRRRSCGILEISRYTSKDPCSPTIPWNSRLAGSKLQTGSIGRRRDRRPRHRLLRVGGRSRDHRRPGGDTQQHARVLPPLPLDGRGGGFGRGVPRRKTGRVRVVRGARRRGRGPLHVERCAAVVLDRPQRPGDRRRLAMGDRGVPNIRIMGHRGPRPGPGTQSGLHDAERPLVPRRRHHGQGREEPAALDHRSRKCRLQSELLPRRQRHPVR